uniref:Uncharacterized protein n=1 Tax=Echeneis naucrates TaxID=173247 RepID=A0A665UG36_ECHNA
MLTDAAHRTNLEQLVLRKAKWYKIIKNLCEIARKTRFPCWFDHLLFHSVLPVNVLMEKRSLNMSFAGTPPVSK